MQAPEPTPLVVLLRAVNVAGHGRLPMADLRAAAASAGAADVATYNQSGNLIATPFGDPAAWLGRLATTLWEERGLVTTLAKRAGA